MEYGTGVFSIAEVVDVAIVAPAPVSNLQATPADGGLYLSWSLGAVTGGSPLATSTGAITWTKGMGQKKEQVTL